MFKNIIAQLENAAYNPSERNFVAVQQVQNQIINAYKGGSLDHRKYKALSELAAIIRDDMREELRKV